MVPTGGIAACSQQLSYSGSSSGLVTQVAHGREGRPVHVLDNGYRGKEGMAETVSGTMAVNRGVWVGDPWCWSLSAFLVCS